jgi:hypothetical protein
MPDTGEKQIRGRAVAHEAGVVASQKKLKTGKTGKREEKAFPWQKRPKKL